MAKGLVFFTKQKRWFGIVLLAALLISGAIAWLYFEQPEPADIGAPMETTVAKTGDLELSATGSGTLAAQQTYELNFPVEGVVSELNVQPGDQVKQGEVLAVLDHQKVLELKVKKLQLELASAEKTLNDTLNGGEQVLAEALTARANALETLTLAEKDLHQNGDPRCPDERTRQYLAEYTRINGFVDDWEDQLNNPNTGYGTDFIMEQLTPLRKQRDEAYNNWKYCEGFTDAEIASSDANLQMAQAAYKQADHAYQQLAAEGGVDPVTVELAQAKVDAFRLQLSQAEDQLAGITMASPIDGTVLSVAASEGESVGTNVFLTLVDLQRPVVEIQIDETDLLSLAVGCDAEVTFTALPDRTFTGKVSQINPVLISAFETSVVEGLVDLQGDTLTLDKGLPLGLQGTVEITCRQAVGALLIPITALHEDAGSKAYVYVLSLDGQVEKREVETGLRNTAMVEIRSGLVEGERVVTSAVQES